MLTLRRELKETSDLGEFGARAIRDALEARGLRPVPAVRTINRILDRRGALDGRRRVRRPAPPPGWYLPDVAARRAELDSFDIVEGLVIKGGPQVEVLNAISLHGGLVASWPMAASVTAKAAVEALIEHWRAVGLPGYAQFDNDTIFQGPHQHTDVVGRVMRLCLSLGVVPVFVPPREPGFQAAIERLQRPLAGQGLGPVRARVAGRAARPARAGTWPRPGRGPRRGSRRPRPGGRSPRAGAGPAGPAAGPDRLPEADRRAGRRRGAGPAVRGGTPRGRTGWSGRRWTWTPAGSGSTPCGGASRTDSRCSVRWPTGCLAGGSRSDRESLRLAIESRPD